MQLIVEVVGGPSAGKKVVLKSSQTAQVGRGMTELSVADDRYLSSAHFAVECGAYSCRIRDLGSANGTLVNGAKVKEAVLYDGDQIAAGRTTFKVRVARMGTIAEPDAPVPPAAPPGAAPTHAPAPSGVGATYIREQSAKTMDGSATPPAPMPPIAPVIPRPISPAKPEPARAVEKTLEDEDAATPTRAVVSILDNVPDPLFALVDAARDPAAVLGLLQNCNERYQSLYEGPKGEQLAAAAPYLVRLPPRSPFLTTLVRRGWGKSWGVYLTCGKPFEDLRKHLRHFLLVKTEEGKELYFRFYDPRVLRVFLPTCTPQESAEFLGPIQCYLMEDEKTGALLRFTADDQAVRQKAVSIAVAAMR